MITFSRTKRETNDYLDFLFSQNTTERFCDVSLGSNVRKKPEKLSKLWGDYLVRRMPATKIQGEVEIKLRVDSQPKSSLNLCLEAGRKNAYGLYAPRPWYEVEITAQAEEIKNPCYPASKLLKKGSKSRKGKFNAYIEEDGKFYLLKMAVSSANGKAIFSSEESGGRETFGRYIKGKLEDAGVLSFGETVTSDVLEAYRKDHIVLKKIGEKDYILEF